MDFIKQIFKGLSHLFFPEVCVFCKKQMPIPKEFICFNCKLKVAKTDFQRLIKNEFTERLRGKVKLERGFALYYYSKNNPVQKIIHQLKYKNNTKIGVTLGERLGKDILKYNHLKFDFIVPIPLHPKKKILRGYNQSEIISNGLKKVLNVKISTHSLVKVINNKSQTTKGKLDRIVNVQSSFLVLNPDLFKNKHILLVDDVITTGSTLDACIHAIKEAVPTIKVSVAALAFVRR